MHSNDPPLSDPAQDKLDECRQRVVGTNIDSKSLLSTDYFNTFNSIIMILDMLPDAPELIDEIEQWKFMDYIEHFKSSGLDFANLAIEVYPFSPSDLREAFERKIYGIRIIVENTAHILRGLIDVGEKDAVAKIARNTVVQLHAMLQEGNGIVHGTRTIAQTDIDKLF